MQLPEQKKIISGYSKFLDWSAIILPKKNEDVSGDLFLVKNYNDQILIAVIDGLGHGIEALKASKRALQSLNSFTNQSLISLVNNAHTELKKTRGVVMNLAVFDCWEHTMSWTGVGNVEGVLYKSDEEGYLGRENIMVRGGVVGYKLPSLKSSMMGVSEGDTLIFSTDGVKPDYIRNVSIKNTPSKIVDYIASTYVDNSDDALILVARYKGVNL